MCGESFNQNKHCLPLFSSGHSWQIRSKMEPEHILWKKEKHLQTPICCFHNKCSGGHFTQFFWGGGPMMNFAGLFCVSASDAPKKTNVVFSLPHAVASKNQCELRKVLGSKQTSENSYHHFSIVFFWKNSCFLKGFFKLMANSTAPQTAGWNFPS